MRTIGQGLSGVVVIAALVGCGSGSGSSDGGSGGTTSVGGNSGAGKGGNGGAGKAGTTGTGGASGSGGASVVFASSVSSGTKLTALSGSQALQLCDDINTYLNRSFVPVFCGAIRDLLGPQAAYQELVANPAATDGDLRAACAAQLAEAGSCSDVDASVANNCTASSFATVPSTCTATVGDYAACVSAIDPTYSQYGTAAPNCSTLTAASLTAFYAADGGGTTGPADPAPCAIFGTGAACSGVSMPTTGTKK